MVGIAILTHGYRELWRDAQRCSNRVSSNLALRTPSGFSVAQMPLENQVLSVVLRFRRSKQIN